ncbi:MAG: sensor domain-containing diguanylate cyclase [Vulcanimicrobiaceae bacterium]
MADPTVLSLDELRARVEELERRLSEVESERNELAAENAELLVFQQVLSTINASLAIDDILSIVIRGVREALRFRRIILFDMVEGRARRRLETNNEGNVVPSRSGDFRESSSLRGVVQRTLDYHLGSSGDGESPVGGTKGAYALVPMISRDIVRGVLYVEGPPTDGITDMQVRMLIDFGSQAAIAIENAQLLGETQQLAMTDSLTGLLNRRALEQMLDRELLNAERYNAHLAFFIFDLDDLQTINDTGGHPAGDTALKALAEVLRGSARKGDIVARYAGDEFVLVLTNTNRPAAVRGVERVFTNLARHSVRASAGGAIFPNDGTDGKALFRSADAALYVSKQAGKNRFFFFDALTQAATAGNRPRA